jgi:tetratricopeptide (TPR) repeat protein
MNRNELISRFFLLLDGAYIRKYTVIIPELMKRNIVIFIYSALILSTLLVFWQVRNFDFVNYDDKIYVYENPHVLHGLTRAGVIWAFTTNQSANWHPLTWLSHMLDCEFLGQNPGRMHLINLFIHLANALLLFMTLRKMTAALWQSAFVAAAFALHPMHVESVAWIAERKDVLSTLFWLLTMLAYLAYVRRPGVFRYTLTLILFTLGLMAKPMLVTLPFVLLLLDYWPLSKIRNLELAIRNLLLEKVPFFILAAASSVITYLVQRSGRAVISIESFSLKDRIANAFLSYARYTGKFFWPQNLAAFYPFNADRFPYWQIVSCALLLLGIFILVIYFGPKHRYLVVGWFWFVGTLVPVIGLVQVGWQSYADRYTYIPYTGLFIMLAWGLPELLSGWPYRKIVLGMAASITLIALGTGAYRQAGCWKNGYVLFSHAIKVTADNYFAYNNLGVAYEHLGRYQDAIEAYHQAVRIKPDYAQAHFNLGNACLILGRYQDAIEAYQQAVRIKPDFAEAYFNIGIAFYKFGRYQDAVESYKQYIKIKPDFADAYVTLGAAYDKLGRIQDAIESWKQAVRIRPDFAEVYSNLGAAFYKLGRYQEAIESLKQAVRIKPNYVDAHSNLGIIYVATGDKASALEEYKILKTLDAKQADQLYNLIYQ